MPHYLSVCLSVCMVCVFLCNIYDKVYNCVLLSICVCMSFSCHNGLHVPTQVAALCSKLGHVKDKDLGLTYA
jgi:hypothetical protein